MVGWSRRNRESRERRERWWASLSEEEKQAWIAAKPEREAAERRMLLKVVPTFFFIYLGFILFMAWIR